jgi:hypothetical protein
MKSVVKSRNLARRDTEGDAMTSKQCNVCSEDKELNNFDKSNEGILGRAGRCKVCQKDALSKQKLEKRGGTKRKLDGFGGVQTEMAAGGVVSS